ncbi:MAG: NAD(P)H-dependent oxidoreductase [Candidatus Sumerlaeia bacterium]|nr:NAD(P)H-dependent oxidoreductase [Candidatus Sumerlaeia bacterium]
MIELVSGTNRADSNTLKITKLIQAKYAAQGVTTGLIDLAQLPVSAFSPTAYAQKPAELTAVLDRILKADGVHVVVPEYNGSFPGALKLFIDLLKFPESFEQRCVCYTGIAAGQWGALRAVEQLQLVFSYRNALNSPSRVFIPLIGGKLSPEGTLNDAAIDALLVKQAKEFSAFVERNKGLANKG